MTAVTPDSTIRLLKCPIKLDDRNQLTFASTTAQLAYFQSLPYLTDANMTYIRKDGVIRVGTNSSSVDYEDLLQYNYVMYQNTHYDSKWFYAYITDVKYINDGCTELSIETDVFQTWSFDATFKQSFIEREHVNDDTIGKHTIPELLEKGEYLPSDSSFFIYNNNLSGMNWVPCVGVSENVFTTNYIKIYNNTYSGLQYIALEGSDDIANFMNYYASLGKISEIYTLFIIPIAFISDNVETFTWSSKTVTYGGSSHTIYYKEVPSSYSEFELGYMQLARPTQLGVGSNKYTPKNNKLFTSEYMYMLVDNMCGSVAKYDYEYFANTSQCTFHCKGAINSGCSIKLYPTNYKNVTYNYSEGMTCAKLPVCSWISDVYTNWLTSHAVDIPLNIANNLFSTVTGGMKAAATGDVSGITNGMTAIGNTISEIYQHSLAPLQAQGNTNVGDVMYAIGAITPTIYKMTIKKEYAEIIDNYLSMYGYKVNRTGIPHIHVRSKWDYCKTIDIHITGNIPEKDMAKLRDLFNKGCTFWHDSSHFMDYSQTNSIL